MKIREVPETLTPPSLGAFLSRSDLVGSVLPKKSDPTFLVGRVGPGWREVGSVGGISYAREMSELQQPLACKLPFLAAAAAQK